MVVVCVRCVHGLASPCRAGVFPWKIVCLALSVYRVCVCVHVCFMILFILLSVLGIKQQVYGEEAGGLRSHPVVPNWVTCIWNIFFDFVINMFLILLHTFFKWPHIY